MPLLTAALLVVSHASAGPRLSVPAAPVPAGSAVTITLAVDGTAVSLDGCSPVELERKRGERWEPVESPTLCDGITPARVATKDLIVSIAVSGPGEYRAVATFGTGCVAGRAFAQAACKSTGTVRSGAFIVDPAPQR
ncbi:MAG: hypothetical protein ACK4YP_00645 [Myxococcota bacterium]